SPGLVKAAIPIRANLKDSFGINCLQQAWAPLRVKLETLDPLPPLMVGLGSSSLARDLREGASPSHRAMRQRSDYCPKPPFPTERRLFGRMSVQLLLMKSRQAL